MRFEQTQSQRLQTPIAAHRFVDGVPRTSKLRRIEYDHAKALASRCQRIQFRKNIAPHKGQIVESVEPSVVASQLQSRLGLIETQHGGRARAGGVQSESAGVTEGIEYTPAARQPRRHLPIVALIEIEPRFLPFRQVDQKPQSTLLDLDRPRRRIAPYESIVRFESFELADAALRALVDSRRLQ